ITTDLDPEIEKMGFDKMRSRIVIRLKTGRTVEGWADERYRGGPENPLSDTDLEAKVRSCCEGILDDKAQTKLIDAAWKITETADAAKPMRIIQQVSPLPILPASSEIRMNRRKFSKILLGTGAALLAPFNIVRAQSNKLKVGVLLPKSGLQGVIGQSCQ